MAVKSPRYGFTTLAQINEAADWLVKIETAPKAGMTREAMLEILRGEWRALNAALKAETA